MAFKKSFRNSIKEYLTFTNSERKPILFLIALILISLCAMVYIKFIPENATVDFSHFEKEIDAFEKQITADSILAASLKNKRFNENKSSTENEPLKTYPAFVFNPNNLPDSLWQKLGIRERVIRTIKKYESKGGRFYKKEDLKKIYGFHQEDYERLEAFIV